MEDEIGYVIDSLYSENVKEPELSKALLKYGNDIDIIFIKAIRDFVAEREKICFLAKRLQNLSDIETLLYKCLSLRRNSDYPMMASFLIQCLEKDLSIMQINNVLEKAKEWSQNTGNNISDVTSYLNSIKGEKIYAPVPNWVSIHEGENLSLLKTIIPGDGVEANKKREVEFIAQAHELFHEIDGKKIRGQGVNINLEEAMQAVLSAYSESENPEQTSADRVFGPLNRIKDRECISNPYNIGPCRMLECICREFDDISHDGKIESVYSKWFKGKCMTCGLGIRDASHAVRLPLEEGGWYGCYCSIECIREDETILVTEKLNIRINNMIHILDEAGIMDRTKI